MVLRRKFRRGRSGSSTDDDPRVDHDRPLAKVVVKFRPMLQEEVNAGETLCVTVHGGEVKLKPPKNVRVEEQGQRTYRFDRAIAPSSHHSEAYQAAVGRLVNNVMSGHRGVLLLAGPPGSGKSRALWGPASAPGVLPLALAALAREARSIWAPVVADASIRFKAKFRICSAALHDNEAFDLMRHSGACSGRRSGTWYDRTGTCIDDDQDRASRWSFSAPSLMAILPSPPRSSRQEQSCRSSRKFWGGSNARAAYGKVDADASVSRTNPEVSEVTAEGVDEALELVRQSLESRGKGHLAISVRMSMADTAGSRNGIHGRETGELTVIKIGDSEDDSLPGILQTALNRLKVGQVNASPPTSTSHPKLQDTWPPSSPVLHSKHGRLWALLDYLMADAKILHSPNSSKSGKRATPITDTVNQDDATVHNRPVALSVLLTLRAGTGHYKEKLAVLEALSRFTTSVAFLQRERRPVTFNRMISLTSFTRRGHSSTTTAIVTKPTAPSRSSSSSSSKTSADAVQQLGAPAQLAEKDLASKHSHPGSPPGASIVSDASLSHIEEQLPLGMTDGKSTFHRSCGDERPLKKEQMKGEGEPTHHTQAIGNSINQVGLIGEQLDVKATSSGDRAAASLSHSVPRHRSDLCHFADDARWGKCDRPVSTVAGDRREATDVLKSDDEKHVVAELQEVRGLSHEQLVSRVLQAERMSHFWKTKHAEMERQLASIVRDKERWDSRVPLAVVAETNASTGESCEVASFRCPRDCDGSSSEPKMPTEKPPPPPSLIPPQGKRTALNDSAPRNTFPDPGGTQFQSDGGNTPAKATWSLSTSGEPAQAVTRKLVEGTPPGTAEARRSIRASTLSFAERRAAFCAGSDSGCTLPHDNISNRAVEVHGRYTGYGNGDNAVLTDSRATMAQGLTHARYLAKQSIPHPHDPPLLPPAAAKPALGSAGSSPPQMTGDANDEVSGGPSVAGSASTTAFSPPFMSPPSFPKPQADGMMDARSASPCESPYRLLRNEQLHSEEIRSTLSSETEEDSPVNRRQQGLGYDGMSSVSGLSHCSMIGGSAPSPVQGCASARGGIDRVSRLPLSTSFTPQYIGLGPRPPPYVPNWSPPKSPLLDPSAQVPRVRKKSPPPTPPRRGEAVVVGSGSDRSLLNRTSPDAVHVWSGHTLQSKARRQPQSSSCGDKQSCTPPDSGGSGIGRRTSARASARRRGGATSGISHGRFDGGDDGRRNERSLGTPSCTPAAERIDASAQRDTTGAVDTGNSRISFGNISAEHVLRLRGLRERAEVSPISNNFRGAYQSHDKNFGTEHAAAPSWIADRNGDKTCAGQRGFNLIIPAKWGAPRTVDKSCHDTA